MQKFLLFLGLIFSLSFSIGCQKSNGASTALSQNTLKFAQLSNLYSVVTHIAEVQGYCKDEGLDYSSMVALAGPDAAMAVKGGGSSAADAADMGLTPLATLIGAGESPVVLATISFSNWQTKLITFSQNHISENPSTLRGKSIGVTRGTNGDIYLTRLLKKGQLTPSDVSIVNARPPDLRGLLVRGQLDTAILWDPYVEQAIREYHEGVAQHKIPDRGEPKVYIDPSIYTVVVSIVVPREKLPTRRQQYTKFLRALLKAEKFISQNPKKAEDLVETWLGIQKGDMKQVFATTNLNVELDVPRFKKLLTGELEWFQETHSNAQMPKDLSPYIDASLLKSIDSSHVKE